MPASAAHSAMNVFILGKRWCPRNRGSTTACPDSPTRDRHDHKTRSAQDLDLEETLLFGPEGVLDHVRANQFDGAIHLLGVPQAEPMGNLLHEVDQGW